MDYPPASPETSVSPSPAPTPAPAPASDPQVPSPQRLSILGGVLSYLVPGLGQIAQGRTAKGVLFLVCIYFLFFYGMYLGAAEVKIGVRTYRMPSNVYVPQTDAKMSITDVGSLINYPRPQIAAQFWVGAIVWPAFLQSNHVKKEKDTPVEAEIEEAWTAAENETDPERQSVKVETAQKKEKERLHPVLGDFMREPSLKAINAVHNGKDKRLELAWVFTVIAGVLNIMVILDALAGPAFPTPPDEPKKES